MSQVTKIDLTTTTTNPINEYAQDEIQILSVLPDVEHLCARVLCVVASFRRLVRKEYPLVATCYGASRTFLPVERESFMNWRSTHS